MIINILNLLNVLNAKKPNPNPIESIIPLEPDIRAISPMGIQFNGLCIKKGARTHINEASIILLPITPNIVGVLSLKLSKVSSPKDCIIISKVINKNTDWITFLTGSKFSIFVQAK